MTLAKKMSHTVQDKKMQFKESLLPEKPEPNSWKKWHLYKNDCGQKNLTQTA